MTPIEILHTGQAVGGMDTTGLVWHADAGGLSVGGTFRLRGMTYDVTEQWPWPQHPKRVRWQVLVKPDGGVVCVHDGEGWAAEYQRWAMVAHGWMWPPGDPDPWEHVFFVNVAHEGLSWSDERIGHHFTGPDGGHMMERPDRGHYMVRAPNPRPGGGFWPLPG